ncbi:MAG: Type 1 glutamine amidotransferase-like domain-containing protein [Myxococcota bacterium]
MLPPVVLGPQRPTANAPRALAELAPGPGPIVVLTAGWRADELDEEVIQRHLGPEAAVLPLYTWFEVVMRELPDLRQAYRARQDALVDLRRLHRTRLHRALEVVRELVELEQTPLVRDQLALAFDDVRRIDDQLLDAAAAIHAEHARASEPWNAHPSVARLRERATVALRGARAVAIAGGHVAVLLNRMQFFGVDAVLREIAGQRPIVAWSAGSMVLADRVVLFYDDPPDGPAFPEVLDRGFGIVPGVVVLPHARQRLRLDQPSRVAALVTRFRPARCIGTENGAWLVQDAAGDWANRGEPDTAFELQADGEVRSLPAAAGGAL